MAAQAHPPMQDEAPGVVATPERIDAWMEIAKPGDRFVYATRAYLPAASAGAKRMRILATRGLVNLVRPRSTSDRSVFHYTAVRTSKVAALSRPERAKLSLASPALAQSETAIVDALLPVITRFAAHGRPCPTDRQLGERAGLDEDAVKAGLAAMVAARLIHVEGCSAPTYRRVLILSTGQRTGLAA